MSGRRRKVKGNLRASRSMVTSTVSLDSTWTARASRRTVGRASRTLRTLCLPSVGRCRWK